MASGRNGTLYCGVTNDLVRRVHEHRERRAEGFTSRYGVSRLVWFEQHSDIDEAILREKRIKTWNRGWKLALTGLFLSLYMGGHTVLRALGKRGDK